MDNLHVITRLCTAVLVSAISAGTASSSNAAILENNAQNAVKEQKTVTTTMPDVIKYSSTEGGYVRSIMDGSPVRATVESVDSVLVGSEAIPEEGYEFVCWYDEEGKFVSFMPELIAKQDSEIRAYKAHFRKIIQPVDSALTTFPAAVAGVNRPVSEEKEAEKGKAKEEVTAEVIKNTETGQVKEKPEVVEKQESFIEKEQEPVIMEEQEPMVESPAVKEEPAAEPAIEEVQEPEAPSEESSEEE